MLSNFFYTQWNHSVKLDWTEQVKKRSFRFWIAQRFGIIGKPISKILQESDQEEG